MVAGLSPAITNMAIVLLMVQAAKKIPFDNPDVMWMCRGAYILSNIIIAGLYLTCRSKVNAKKDMTTLKYVEPAPMGSTEEPKLVTTTIHAYDLSQLQQAFRGQIMGMAMMAFMHLYMGYTNPLLIQSIIPLKGALESNMVKIHIYGKPAVGDLKRPFKQASGILAGLTQGQNQNDKKSIEAAEKAGRGGAKEE